MCAELSFIFYFSSFSKGQIVTHRCSHSTSQQQSTERQTRIWIISEMRRELSSYLDVVVIFHLHYNNSFMMWHSTLSCHTAHTADAHTIPTIRQSSSSLLCVVCYFSRINFRALSIEIPSSTRRLWWEHSNQQMRRPFFSATAKKLSTYLRHFGPVLQASLIHHHNNNNHE